MLASISNASLQKPVLGLVLPLVRVLIRSSRRGKKDVEDVDAESVGWIRSRYLRRTASCNVLDV